MYPLHKRLPGRWTSLPRQTMAGAAMDTVDSERSEFEEVEAHQDGTQLDEEQFASVDDLQAHGIGAADIQKLKVAGICTIKVGMPFICQ